MSKLKLPENIEPCTKAWYEEMTYRIQEASERVRGSIIDPFGNLVWQEPLEEYEERMKQLEITNED